VQIICASKEDKYNTVLITSTTGEELTWSHSFSCVCYARDGFLIYLKTQNDLQRFQRLWWINCQWRKELPSCVLSKSATARSTILSIMVYCTDWWKGVKHQILYCC